MLHMNPCQSVYCIQEWRRETDVMLHVAALRLCGLQTAPGSPEAEGKKSCEHSHVSLHHTSSQNLNIISWGQMYKIEHPGLQRENGWYRDSFQLCQESIKLIKLPQYQIFQDHILVV